MNRFYITDRHIDTSTAEHIQTDGNLTPATDSHQFADKTAQRTFYDTDLLTTGDVYKRQPLSYLQCKAFRLNAQCKAM